MGLFASAVVFVVVVYIAAVVVRDLPTHLGRCTEENAPPRSASPKPARPGPRPIQASKVVPKPERSVPASPKLKTTKRRRSTSSSISAERVRSTRRVVSDSAVATKLRNDISSETRGSKFLEVPSTKSRKRVAVDLSKDSDITALSRGSSLGPAFDFPGAFPSSPLTPGTRLSSAATTPETDYADSIFSTFIKSTHTTPPPTPPPPRSLSRKESNGPIGKLINKEYCGRDFEHPHTPCASEHESENEDEGERCDLESNDEEVQGDGEDGTSESENGVRVSKPGDRKNNPIQIESDEECESAPSPLAQKSKNKGTTKGRDMNPDKSPNKRIPEKKKRENLLNAGVVIRDWDEKVAIPSQKAESDTPDVRDVFRKSWEDLDKAVNDTRHICGVIMNVIRDYRTLKLSDKEPELVKSTPKKGSGRVQDTERNINYRVDSSDLELESSSSKVSPKNKGKRPTSSKSRKRNSSSKAKVTDEDNEDEQGEPAHNIDLVEDKSLDDEENENHREWHEPIWQALYFCYSHGIINRVLRNARTRYQMPDNDNDDIIATIETKKLFSSKITELGLRKTETYSPDGLYGYHNNIFPALPKNNVYCPVEAYDLCLPFFCCELKPVQKPGGDNKKLAVENQIMERMMHICTVYHELEKAANFPRGDAMSSTPAIGFTSIGADFTFWLMFRYSNPHEEGKITYDLRKTWSGSLFKSEDVKRLIRNICNIQRHAYTTRRNLIDECISHAYPVSREEIIIPITPPRSTRSRRKSSVERNISNTPSSSKSAAAPITRALRSVSQGERKKAVSEIIGYVRPDGASRVTELWITTKTGTEHNCLACREANPLDVIVID